MFLNNFVLNMVDSDSATGFSVGSVPLRQLSTLLCTFQVALNDHQFTGHLVTKSKCRKCNKYDKQEAADSVEENIENEETRVM